MQRAILTTLLAALALLAVSCGGGGGQLSKAEYERQIGAILQPLQSPTGPLQKIVLTSAADPKGAVNALRARESALRDAASQVAEMKPPDDAVDPTQRVAKGLNAIASEVTAARKGAEKGNLAKLIKFKVELGSDPAILELQTAARDLINLGYNIAGEGP